MSDSAKWYVIHTYSGYENAVKTSIEKFVTGRGLEDQILRMEIPMETVTEVTDSGATKEVERKVFPGYVLIKMIMTDETWHLVRNVRGVTGFVGSANKAIPLTEEEVLAMGMEKHEIVVRYDRTGEEPGQRGGLHVRQRDPCGTGTGPGRGPDLTVRRFRAPFCRSGSGASGRGPGGPAKDGFTARHHIYDLGGATPWHRK